MWTWKQDGEHVRVHVAHGAVPTDEEVAVFIAAETDVAKIKLRFSHEIDPEERRRSRRIGRLFVYKIEE